MATAGDAFGSYERPHAAGYEDGRRQRRASQPVREVAADRRPDDQREAQARDDIDLEHHPHHSPHNRLIEDPWSCGYRDNHEHDCAPALEVRHAAEERPPHQDSHCAHEFADHCDDQALRRDDRYAKPD